MAFRDIILSNSRRKLFSLALAILIWTTIHFADKRHRQTTVPALPTNSVIFP